MKLRSDIDAAAAGMVASSRVDRELRELADHLHKREQVRRLCSGVLPTGYGLMAITNRRVILLRAGQRGAFSSDVPLRQLSVTDWAPGLLGGTITIAGPGGRTELKNVQLAEGEEIVRFVRARMRSWSRLGALRGRSPRTGPGEPVRTLPEAAAEVSAPLTAPARSLEEADTELLERVGSGSSPGSGTRHRAWQVAAAAGLVGVVGLGLYLGVSQPATDLEAAGTPQPEVANVAPAPSAPPPVVGVVRVVGADSLEVAGGASGPVEVLGIVAPQNGQCGADVAMRFATTKLLGTAVTLVTEPSQPVADGAGRILAHVRLPNGMDYAVLAARAGVVKYHESGVPVARAEEIKAAQAEAEASHEGLWGAPCHGAFAGGHAATPE